MIVDWQENCEQIFATNHLKDNDVSDRKIKYQQELVYLDYLLVTHHCAPEHAFNCWKQINNGVASLFKNDPDQLRIEFGHMLQKASKDKYVRLSERQRLTPVVIYLEEIAFLNNLNNVPLWVRQYWACLFFYYKFAVQVSSSVEKTPTLNAWCIRHSDYKKKNYGGNCQDIISQYNRGLSHKAIRDFLPSFGHKYPTYRPCFVKEEGIVVGIYDSIDDIKDFLKLICPNFCVCSQCGARFVVSSKTKRTLCDKCYAEYRKKYKKHKKNQSKSN